MALVEELSAYLIANGIGDATAGGPNGWEIKTGTMTETQDRQILIRPFSGVPPEAGTDLEYPAFQLTARAEGFEHVAPRAILDTIMGLLHATSPTMGGKPYIGILATQSVATLLEIDANDRAVYVQNYRTFRSRS